MSFDHNFPRLAIDADTFARALDGGALDACLAQVYHDELADPDTAALICRLGERLFHGGRRSDALECGRRAFAAAANDNEVAHFCAWLFSNCGAHAEAAAAYEQLIARHPDWIEGYRHASGAFAAIGEMDRAIVFATTASDLAPARFDFAHHAGCLLLDAGRPDEAARYFERGAENDPDNAEAWRALSATTYARGRLDDAVRQALHAAALAPTRPDIAIHAAELLQRNGRFDAALDVLDRAREHAPADAALWRLASAVEAERGAVDAGLAAIDRALRLAPECAEFHLHRAHLLRRVGDRDAAAAAIERAAVLDPADPAAWRAQLDLFLSDDRLAEATAIGGELLRAFPDDEQSAEAVLQVLNRRLETIDGEYVVLGDRTRHARRAPSVRPGFFAQLRSQARVIQALVIRETRTRFGDSRLGYGWALIEPILHIVLLSTVFSLLMHGRPPLGTHFFVFYYTGLIPYHVFVHTSTSMMHGIANNGALLRLPPVKPFDVLLARGVLEFVTDIVVAVALLAGFAAFGIPAMPDDVGGFTTALVVTALLGCGVGFANGVVQTLFRSWDKLWNNATRLLYFFSGIFYVPGMMPDWARDVLAWNPLLHAIDWARAAFFTNYQPHWLDPGYLLLAAAVALLAGLSLERALRHRLSEPA